MKTKITLFTAFLLSICVYAQDNKNVSSEMDKYTKKIDSIVQSEKTNMNIELDKLDERLKGNNASVTEEKSKRRKEIAEKYEQIINEKIENEKSELETATKELVKFTVLNPNKKYSLTVDSYPGGVLFRKKRVMLPKDYLHSVKLSVGFLGTSLVTKNEPLGFFNGDSEIKNGFNSSYLALRYENQLGSFKSPFFYRFGVGYRSDRFVPKQDKVFSQNEDYLYLHDFTKGALKKTGLYNCYITIPLEVKWVLNPKFVDHENVKYIDNRKTQMYIVAGLYGGVRVTSFIYNKFSTDYSKRIVERETVSNGVNNFLVGGKFGIGYGGVGLFIQKDFTPTFNNDALLLSKYGLQVGLELASINF